MFVMWFMSTAEDQSEHIVCDRWADIRRCNAAFQVQLHNYCSSLRHRSLCCPCYHLRADSVQAEISWK